MTTNLYNFNSGDYRDRYTTDSGWVKLLFNSGRPLQTTELIEVQSMLQDFIKQGLDTLFANGTILSGLTFTIFSTDSTDSTITLSMSSGKFYVDGLVIDVPSNSISVSTSGTYNIGLVITPQIITEVDNPILRDPIKGGANYGLPGAARLIWNTSLDTNNNSAYTLIQVVNGSLIQNATNLYSQIDASLADYTYTRNGNFCVNGLDVSVLNSQPSAISDTNKYNALNTAATNSLNDTQSTYNNLLSAQNTLTLLTSQLGQAQSTYNITPTSANLLVVQDLTQRQSDAQTSYNTLLSLYASKKLISDAAQANLTAAQNLLVESVYININPGVAYVQGYRININSPVILQIPKNLSTSEIDSVQFTYSGTQATSLRTFSLASGAAWTDVVSQFTQLTITFTQLTYNQTYVNCTIVFDLTNTLFSTLDDALDYLIAQINQSITAPLNGITISSTTTTLTTEQIRVILNNNITIQRSGDALLFTSTTLNTNANQISVGILLQQLASDNGAVVGTSPVLLVDVTTANLSGAASSNSFQLGFRPVANIISLVADLQQNLIPIVRGPIPNTSDKLTSSSIFKITQVIQGGTVYTQGIDYQLTNQSEVDWSLDESNSIEPAAGTTYYVSFLYSQPLALNTDYTLDASTDSIIFTNTTPAPNQNFFVSYTYYLALAGTIYLDNNGVFNYKLSTSSINPIPPIIDSSLLTIATFILYSNSTTLTPNNCSLVSLSELNSLVTQVKKNTADLQSYTLDNTSRLLANNNNITPIGYYNTTLQDLTKLNYYSPQSTGGFSAGIQAITGGYINSDINIKYTTTGNSGSNFIDEFGSPLYVTLPYSSSTIIFSQERLTQTEQVTIVDPTVIQRGKILVTPYISFSNTGASVFTACDVLSQQTTLLSRLTNSTSLVLQRISTGIQNIFKSFGDKLYNSFLNANPLGNSIQDTSTFLGYIGSIVQTNPASIVYIIVENLPPSSEGYRVYLAGVEIRNYILTGTTPLSVIYPGTIKANTDGTIYLNFTIPSGFSFGVHTLEIISDANSGYAKTQIGIYNNLYTQITTSALENWDVSFSTPVATSMWLQSAASSNDQPVFQASSSLVNPGSLPAINLSTPSLDQQFPFVFDSINQTFTVANYYYLTGINIKLSSIDINYPLIINLGQGTNNGPDRSLIGVANATNYNPDSTGNTYTTFTFTYPILLEPNQIYNIGLTSKGSGYNVFTALVGDSDLISGSTVGDQLFLQGNYYYSIDGKSLNSSTIEDLTFELLGAVFNISSNITIPLGQYGNVDSLSGVSSFCYNSRDLVPNETNITYQYNTDTDSTWTTFNANNLVCLGVTANYINIQATLISTNTTVSPALLVKGSTVSLYVGLANSTVISQQNIFGQPYTYIAITLTYLQPSNTTINVYYSDNDGGIIDGQEWFLCTIDPTSTTFIDSGLGIQQSTWNYTTNTDQLTYLGAERVKFRFRIDMSTSNTAVQPTILEVMSYVY